MQKLYIGKPNLRPAFLLSIFFYVLSLIHLLESVMSDCAFLYAFLFIATDLIIATLFMVALKMNKNNDELFIAIIMMIWAIYSMFESNEHLVSTAVGLSYSLSLFLKKTRIKLPTITICILFVLIINIISVKITESNIMDSAYVFLLTSLLTTIHISVYHPQYIKKDDISVKYSLSKDHMDVICLISKNVINSQDIADTLYKSKSTIDNYFKTMYSKMDIPEGGNRKAGLILKLAQLGFIANN